MTFSAGDSVLKIGPGSSLSIVSNYGRQGFDSRQRQRIFLVACSVRFRSSPALLYNGYSESFPRG